MEREKVITNPWVNSMPVLLNLLTHRHTHKNLASREGKVGRFTKKC